MKLTARALAVGLAVAAAVLFLAVARPLRARSLAVGDEFRVAREERRQKRELLIEGERREATVRQALAVLAAAPRPQGESVRQVRRTVVQALDNAQLEGVRLSVRPGRASGGVLVRVTASGPVENVLGLTAALAQPGRGVVLDDVRFARDRDGLTVDLAALGFPRDPTAMTRGLAAVAALGAVLLVGGWLLWGAQGISPAPAAPSRLAPRPPSRAQTASPGESATPPRNIFEFAEEARSAAPVDAPPAVRLAPEPPPSMELAPPATVPEAPVRLVGVVLRGGKRKAALAIRGELAVIGPGESADGYTVVAIDDENAVRLEGPDGEITLPPPEGSPGG